MGIKIVAKNKKAFHEYAIIDTVEAGLQLRGTEIKSIRLGKVQLKEGWVEFENDEAFLRDVHISPYSHGNIMNHEETRPRKLLLKKIEIDRLQRTVAEKGLTVIPLKIYLKDSLAKVEIATAKGKKLYDKRETSKRKDADRQIERVLRRG